MSMLMLCLNGAETAAACPISRTMMSRAGSLDRAVAVFFG